MHSRSMSSDHAPRPRLATASDSARADTGDRGLSPLAALMRPALPALVAQVITEIRSSIPESARLVIDQGDPAMRYRISSAVALFVDLVDDPTASRAHLSEVCRQLGREQAVAGHSLDNLLAAYHIGARVAWRWIMRLGRKHNLASQRVSRLAEMLFDYMDELSALSCEGYHEAESAARESDTQARRNLLRLILSQPETPRGAIVELARTAGWELPEQVVLVAVDPRSKLRTAPVRVLGPDTLAELDHPQPHLLIPGPLEAERADRIAEHWQGTRVAIGPAMPLTRAVSSLRWARRALLMVQQGVISDSPVIFCAEHLTTLWLLSEEELLAQVGARKLARLSKFPDRQRRRLASTLSAWLRTNGNVKEIATSLGVHPQTVRYRMRQLQDVLGDELHDPDARFEMEATLRAAQLRADAQDATEGRPDGYRAPTG